MTIDVISKDFDNFCIWYVLAKVFLFHYFVVTCNVVYMLGFCSLQRCNKGLFQWFTLVKHCFKVHSQPSWAHFDLIFLFQFWYVATCIRSLWSTCSWMFVVAQGGVAEHVCFLKVHASTWICLIAIIVIFFGFLNVGA